MTLIIPIVVILCFSIQIWARTINVPHDVEYIQEAIDISNAGDLIYVAPGVYREQIDFSGKNIHVASWYLTSSIESDIDSTIIESLDYGSVVKFANNENADAQLTGFTIRDGYSDYGGGIYIHGASPRLTRLKVRSCSATNTGGGIYISSNSNPYLKFITVTGSKAWHGGGIAVYNNCDVNLESSLIIDNDSTHAGAGLHCAQSTLRLHRVTVKDNLATPNGHGGGLWASLGSTVYMEGATFDSNYANILGGAIYASNSTLIINNATISNNVCDYSAGAIYCENRSEVSLNRVLISGNIAKFVQASAIMAVDTSFVSLFHTTITENIAERGEELLLIDKSEFEIKNSIIWNNSPRGIWLTNSLGDSISARFSYSDIQDRLGIIHGDEQIMEWGEGMLNVDPWFWDPEYDDFHLAGLSPCINQGDPNSPLDPDSTRADLGAYWFDATRDIKSYNNIVPDVPKLLSAYPNPFNSRITLELEVPVNTYISFAVYDLGGRKVRSMGEWKYSAGRYQFLVDGQDLPTGTYWIYLQNKSWQEGQKIVLIK